MIELCFPPYVIWKLYHWLDDCWLTPSEQCAAISWWQHYIWWDDDYHVRFALDQHA